MRRVVLALFPAWMVAIGSPAAPADTQLFNVNATLDTGSCTDSCVAGTICGTTTIDVTTGTVAGRDLTATYDGATYHRNGSASSQGLVTIVGGEPEYQVVDDYAASFAGASGAALTLSIDIPLTLAGYAGGPLSPNRRKVRGDLYERVCAMLMLGRRVKGAADVAQ